MGFRHPQIQPESGLCHPRPPANLSHGACETLCLRAGLVHVSAPRSRHIRLPAHTDLTGAVRPGPGLRNATPRPNGQKRVHSLRPSLSRGDRNGQGAMPLEEAPRRQIRQKAVKFLQDFTKASLTPKVMTGGFGDTGSFLRPHCSAHLVSVYYRLLSGHVHFPKVRDLLQCPLIGNPRFILKDLKKKKKLPADSHTCSKSSTFTNANKHIKNRNSNLQIKATLQDPLSQQLASKQGRAIRAGYTNSEGCSQLTVTTQGRKSRQPNS